MRKVCLFSSNLNGGGAERIISLLANQLSVSGYAVDLVLSNAVGPYVKNINKKVKIFDLKCNRASFSIFKLTNYLKMHRPDIVFATQMHTSRALIMALNLSGVQSKIIIRQPTMFLSPYESSSVFKSLSLMFFFFLVRRYVDKIIVTSQTMADEFAFLSRVDRNKISIIYNPLPIAQIQEKSREEIEHPWFQRGQPPVILAVGRLEAVKDFSCLIQAFSLVVKKMKSKLLILGEGSERASLESLVLDLGLQNDVQMPGFVENPYKYMSRAKVFVQSSIREGFSNGLIEAMACGTQVIATDCVGGTAEILGYGKWGELLPVKDVNAMAAALISSLNKEGKIDIVLRAKDFDLVNFFIGFRKILEL